MRSALHPLFPKKKMKRQHVRQIENLGQLSCCRQREKFILILEFRPGSWATPSMREVIARKLGSGLDSARGTDSLAGAFMPRFYFTIELNHGRYEIEESIQGGLSTTEGML